MNRFSCYVLAGMLGVTSTVVLAQEGPGGPGQQERPQRREGGREGGPGGGRGGMMRMNPLMQALDANKDGELSAEEIAGAAAALKKLDKNGDSKLSAEEMRPAFGEGERGGPRSENTAEALARLMAFDKNADGKLAADELPERMRNIVARADTDKDGFATKDELTKALAAQGGGGGPRGERGERGERREREGRPPENQPK